MTELPAAGRGSTSPPTCRGRARSSRPAAAASPRGPFASLNLGRLTADDGASVDANRDRLAATAASARALPLRPPGPRHDRAARHRAEGGARGGGRPGDGAGRCRRARVRRRLPAGAARRGRRRGGRCTAAGAASRAGSSPRASPRCASWARTGPSPPRSAPARAAAATRSARRCLAAFADAPGAAAASATSTCRRRRREAGRGGRADDPRHRAVHDVRRPLLLPPPRRRRDGPPGGGGMAGLSAERVRANAERVRAEIAAAAGRAGRDPGGRRAARRRQVRPGRGPRRAARGRPDAVRREPRAGTRSQGGRLAGRGVRWHFIGQLQSRKVKKILPLVELIHSVASDSALAQLERHGTPGTEILVEVNVAGEDGKAGIAPGELEAFIERPRCASIGLMGMPPFTEDPEASRPHFAALRELAARARAAPPLDGHVAGLRGGRGGGRHDRARRLGTLRIARRGRKPLLAAKIALRMGFSRLLASHARLLRPRRGPRRVRGGGGAARGDPGARGRPRGPLSRAAERPPALSTRRRRDEIDDIFADEASSERRTTVLRPVGGRPANGRSSGRSACTW